MGLKILTNGSGKPSKFWYARFSRNGQKIDRCLDIEIKGKIPVLASGKWDKNGKGDAAFEASKQKAQKAFENLVKDDKNQIRKVKAHETALLALTGKAINKTPLSTLFTRWQNIERGKKPTEDRINAAKATFRAFTAFANSYAVENGTICNNLEDVTPEMAKAYFRKLSDAFAWGTVKDKYGLMRNAWKRFANASGESNPFGEVIMRNGNEEKGRVSRVPLTLLEAKRLFEVVEAKRPALYPLLTCVATTGLRLGDSCNLKWSNIHLASESEIKKGRFGTIDVATSKTGARVVLPIFEPFASVVLDLNKKRDDRDVYVFPQMRERYESKGKRSGLIREIKPFFALAINPEAAKLIEKEEAIEPEDGEKMTLEEIVEKIEASDFIEKKKTNLLAVIKEHFAGFPSSKIAEDLNLARSAVSTYLRDIEELTGETLRPSTKRARKLDLQIDRRALINTTRSEKVKGRKRASLYGWHSLRATFVVLAVEAGVPLAYVEKAVGHAEVEMTLQYFNPTGKHAAEAIGLKLGKAFSNKRALEAPIEATPSAAVTPVVAKPSIEEVFASLSDEDRKKLARLALERAGMI